MYKKNIVLFLFLKSVHHLKKDASVKTQKAYNNKLSSVLAACDFLLQLIAISI